MSTGPPHDTILSSSFKHRNRVCHAGNARAQFGGGAGSQGAILRGGTVREGDKLDICMFGDRHIFVGNCVLQPLALFTVERSSCVALRNVPFKAWFNIQ